MEIDRMESKIIAPAGWVLEIEKELHEEGIQDIVARIFKVKPMLRAVKADAYTPHLMGLGPYHHWRNDIYDMERYKLIAAKPLEHMCERLVNALVEQTPCIRAHYDRHLSLQDDALAWMLFFDAAFLLKFLKAFAMDGESTASKKRLAYLFDPEQWAYHSITKDIIMLENQIPFLVLKQISFASGIANQDLLPKILTESCKRLSPFTIDNDLHPPATEYAHLLDLLYHLILSKDFNLASGSVSASISGTDEDPLSPNMGSNKGSEVKSKPDGILKLPFRMPSLKNVNLDLRVVRIVTKSKPVQFIFKLSGVLSVIFPSLRSFSAFQATSQAGDQGRKDDSPSVEEIKIPSASELHKVGIKFCPLETGNTFNIRLEKKARKFYLPVVQIDNKTEVIMRNLIAYEAAAVPGQLVLARYAELMKGIIDTQEDVRLLRKERIIVNRMKSDEEVEELWNGMSGAVRLTHAKDIDKAIKEVNEYYNRTTRVRLIKFTRSCMLNSWRVLMMVVSLLVLALMAIQSFCSVYRCPRLLSPESPKP